MLFDAKSQSAMRALSIAYRLDVTGERVGALPGRLDVLAESLYIAVK